MSSTMEALHAQADVPQIDLFLFLLHSPENEPLIGYEVRYCVAQEQVF